MYKNCKKPEWAKDICQIPSKNEPKQQLVQEVKNKKQPIKPQKLTKKTKHSKKYDSSSESEESEVSYESSEEECIPVKKTTKNPLRKFL